MNTAPNPAVAALQKLEAALPKENRTARGPVPTPIPVSPRKAKRRQVQASRRANRR